MATRAVFTPKAAEYGATIFPQLLLVNRRPVLRFDGATDEECQWTTVAPQGLTGTVTCLIFFMAVSATTGTIRWEATLEAITPGDATDLDAGDSFAASNSNGGAVPGTAGFLETIGITLTNADSIAPGDYYRFRLRRDADGTTGTDDVTTEIDVLAVEFRDAA